MELDNLTLRVEQGDQLRHFFFKIFKILGALAVLRRDDGGAAAIPAKRLTKRNVEIERKIPIALLIFRDGIRQLGPGHFVMELSGRRVRGVPRAGDIVFFD